MLVNKKQLREAGSIYADCSISRIAKLKERRNRVGYYDVTELKEYAEYTLNLPEHPKTPPYTRENQDKALRSLLDACNKLLKENDV